MLNEENYLREIADIIFSEVENNEVDLTLTKISTDGHFSPKMLSRDQLTHTKYETLFRFLLYIATALPEKVTKRIFFNLFDYIVFVANLQDGSVEAIIDAHAGSPIKRKKK